MTAPNGQTPTVAVVIDVFRAFTTAAVAFNRGASHIVCVAELDDAVALRDAHPGSVLMGEDRGLRPDAFDLGNSPASVANFEMAGRTVIQRTSNGTRGLVDSTADHVIAASAANASATAEFIATTWPDARVAFTPTRPGAEDQACADFIAATLAGTQPSRESFQTQLRQLADAEISKWQSRLGEDHPDVVGYAADVALCCEIDRYDIAMVGIRSADGVELWPKMGSPQRR